MMIVWIFIGLLLCRCIFIELKLRSNYAKKIREKKKRIQGIIDRGPEEKKYCKDLLKIHSNVDHPIGYTLIPGSVAEFTHSGLFAKGYSVYINGYGNREEDYVTPDSIDTDTVTIVFLGDSVVFGAGVSLEETFVKQTQLYLENNGINAVFLNFGVGGYSILESLLSVQYRRAVDYKPRYIILALTIKTLYDLPRCNDPLTGYHMEAAPEISFFLHSLRIKIAGGKLNYLHKKIRDFNRWCRSRNIQFIIQLLPALYQRKILSIATRNEFANVKYSSTLQFMEMLIRDTDLAVWDCSEDFIKYGDILRLYRAGADGNISEFEVHYSEEGNRYLGNLLACKLEQEYVHENNEESSVL